jgi:hypothetical protein
MSYDDLDDPKELAATERWALDAAMQWISHWEDGSKVDGVVQAAHVYATIALAVGHRIARITAQ